LGEPTNVSRGSLTFKVPENLQPGAHVLTGSPAAGFSPADAVVTTVLALAPQIDQNALLRGQSTRARFRVLGATAPVRLRITNQTPGVVSVEGGTDQSLMTSGGSDNAAVLRVRALSKGDFTIHVELGGVTCPCVEGAAQPAGRVRSLPASPGAPVGPESEDPRGFLSARIVALIPQAGVQAMAATAQALAAAFGLVVAEVTPLPSTADGLIVFNIPNAADVLAVAAALNADPRVRAAEPDFVFETTGQVSPQATGAASLKYGARLIGLDRLNPGMTGKDIAVAVIDTGADAAHPALEGRLKFKADVTGSPYKAGIHGTLVSGIVGDLASRAGLLSIQACLAESEQAIRARCSSVTLLKAMNLAMEKKARVINLSLGGPSSHLLQRAIEQAVKNGAVVVAAAGNGSEGAAPPFPATMADVIAVTAVDVEQAPYTFATQGEFIDLAAPGVDILSSAPGGQWLVFSGTSAAAPHVSAVVALMLQQRRALAPANAQEFLEREARDLGASGKDSRFGSGLVDGCRTLARVQPGTSPCR
jgi:subtilisin family serine protease